MKTSFLLAKLDDFGNMMETIALSAAIIVGSGKALSYATPLLMGTRAAGTASQVASKVGTSISSAADSMKNVVTRSFSNKVAAAAADALEIGQKETSSRLSSFIKTIPPNKLALKVITKVGIKALISMTASNAGVYANGKLYVVGGGSRPIGNGGWREEPLRLELYEHNLKLALESCELIISRSRWC